MNGIGKKSVRKLLLLFLICLLSLAVAVPARILGHAPSNSEHLLYIDPEYNYALNINYNRKHIYKKGSGIFLHCMGAKKYTHGCVAVSERNMIRIMQNTTSKTRICIYDK